MNPNGVWGESVICYKSSLSKIQVSGSDGAGVEGETSRVGVFWCWVVRWLVMNVQSSSECGGDGMEIVREFETDPEPCVAICEGDPNAGGVGNDCGSSSITGTGVTKGVGVSFGGRC